jgi:hypothetical protein
MHGSTGKQEPFHDSKLAINDQGKAIACRAGQLHQGDEAEDGADDDRDLRMDRIVMIVPGRSRTMTITIALASGEQMGIVQNPALHKLLCASAIGESLCVWSGWLSTGDLESSPFDRK